MENRDRTVELRMTTGHPLQTFYRENDAIVAALGKIARALDGDSVWLRHLATLPRSPYTMRRRATSYILF